MKDTTMSVGRAEPPENGELYLVVEMPPVSLQAPRKKKDAIIAAIRQAVGDTGYILSGEVKVIIEWLVHPRLKYETLDAPDVDNVTKVTLDALCGPEGVLINDCQVQSLECYWMDWNSSEQRTSIRIQFMNDEWLPKDGLRFVRVKGSLCFPLTSGLPNWTVLHLLQRIEQAFQVRSQSDDYHLGRSLMPLQQLFHVGRLQGFLILSSAELREELARAT
jgi:Holliday junction resolvase RusA-like endonuclease